MNTILSISAQNLTLDDLIPGGKSYAKFVPKNLNRLQWLGNRYMYVDRNKLIISSPTQNKDSLTITTERLNEALAKVGIEPLKNISGIEITADKNDPVFYFVHKDKFVGFDVDKNAISIAIPIDKGDKNRDFDPITKQLIVTSGNALFLIDHRGNRKCIARDDNPNISYGAYGVHRNEFGISKGTFWSPTGTGVAFYKKDETKVGDYPLVDISAREAVLQNIKYPMAGMRNEKVSVGVYFPTKKKTVYLKTGKPYDRYFTNITWSPDGKEIYIQELNRRQDTCRLNVYDAQSGKFRKTLFTETSAKYVEPQTPLYFIPGNPEKFIYRSFRDGHNHLYVYSVRGEMIKQLTHGEWSVIDIIGFDPTGENIYVSSTQNSPLCRDTYRISLNDGKQTRITTGNGTHTTALSANGEYLTDHFSNHDTPREIRLVDTRTTEYDTLLKARNPYTGYSLPHITCGTIKAADDTTDLFYRMVTPARMDTTKKHPVIIYVYGGPHSQLISDTWQWGVRGWDLYMAQRGYIVFTLDNRGTSHRGINFENVTHHQLGIEETKDQMRGIEFLKTLPYADTTKIGVHGWSYGGFMTTNLMLRHPETFKAGVAGGAVIDWKYYEIMYGERYMGSPKENTAGYTATDMKRLAGNLKGKLLLIHCDNDPVVVWQHSLGFLKQAVKERVYPDYFVYPGHKHNVIGVERVHLHEKITRYFDDNLK